MIYISIWKLITYPCWNCHDIKTFSVRNKNLVSDNNFISYSGSTRDEFSKNEYIKNLFKKYEYIQVKLVNDEIQKIILDIPEFGSWKNVWTWFQVYCQKSLDKYWDLAYIKQDCFSDSHWYFYFE